MQSFFPKRLDKLAPLWYTKGTKKERYKGMRKLRKQIKQLGRNVKKAFKAEDRYLKKSEKELDKILKLF